MGIIKSVFRSTMRQARLSMLSMSTEREILRAIHFDDVVDDFTDMKARKASLQV